MVNITFPDGAVREFESGVTTFEIAQSISNSLAKKALAGKLNGKLIDTTRAITEDGSLEIVTPDHEDALPILRHSAAHLFAQAARRLFPDIHLGVGPAIQEGFYYDTDIAAGQINDNLFSSGIHRHLSWPTRPKYWSHPSFPLVERSGCLLAW